MKLFANILQTKQRKEITKPLKTRPVTAYFEQIINSYVLAHGTSFQGCFEEGFAYVITETRTQPRESALSLSHFENPVGDIWDPFSDKADTAALLRPRKREMPNENLLIISLLFMPVPTQDSYYIALKLGQTILEYA